LPYPDADRLLVLQHRDRRTGITKSFIAAGDFADLRALQRCFEALAGFGSGPATIYTGAEPFAVGVLQATPDLFDVLRAHVSRGRALIAADAAEGAAPVVVLGDEVWRERFGGDRSIVGRSI